MPSIIELADCIILDDVTDVFYRSLSFSNYSRTFYDEKSNLEEEFDTLISQRLLDKLDWKKETLSSLATVKFTCELLKSLESSSLTEKKLKQIVNEHASVFDGDLSAQALQGKFLQCTEGSVEELYGLIWQLFEVKMHGVNRHLFEQIQSFSQMIVDKALDSDGEQSLRALKKAALLNALPMLILIKLLDHEIGVVNNLLDVPHGEKVIEPTAETVLSFLVFDEFLKPHILEYIDQQHYIDWMNVQSGEVDRTFKPFLEARTKIILETLSDDLVLTATQKRKFSEQIGSQFKLCSHISNLSNYRSFWRNLLEVTV
ncbi:MAG: hypothetical protein HWE10_00285 [Gammaproteobacteria bacterium]|nr:hypothetical protein [Gammaproteobacteria bacterium]